MLEGGQNIILPLTERWSLLKANVEEPCHSYSYDPKLLELLKLWLNYTVQRTAAANYFMHLSHWLFPHLVLTSVSSRMVLYTHHLWLEKRQKAKHCTISLNVDAKLFSWYAFLSFYSCKWRVRKWTNYYNDPLSALSFMWHFVNSL